ncbi:MAG TPA: hypothetical protein DD761_03430 [Cyanobacteria bacterium UBA11691]|nr:hypothetical protein [Cyanobacteria bacterium UBA11691]
MADANTAAPPSSSTTSAEQFREQLQQRISSSGSGGFQMGFRQGQQRQSASKSLLGRRPLALRAGQFLGSDVTDNGHLKLHFITAIQEAKGLPPETLKGMVAKFGVTKEAIQSGRDFFNTFKCTAQSLLIEGGGQLEVGKIYIIVGSEVPAYMDQSRLTYLDFDLQAIYPESQRTNCLDLLL